MRNELRQDLQLENLCMALGQLPAGDPCTQIPALAHLSHRVLSFPACRTCSSAPNLPVAPGNCCELTRSDPRAGTSSAPDVAGLGDSVVTPEGVVTPSPGHLLCHQQTFSCLNPARIHHPKHWDQLTSPCSSPHPPQRFFS